MVSYPDEPSLTVDEFKGWIEGYGIAHRQAGGDPTALMKLSNEHKVSSGRFPA
jgi:sterol 3beta-glucosyltransferase